MLFTHFNFMQGKKLETFFYLQQADNILTLNLQLFCQQTERNLSTGKMNC